LEFTRRTNRRLHEEHVAVIALCGRLESSLAARKVDPALMRSAAATLTGEVEHHFTFEDVDLFPRLTAAGYGDLVALLEEEHVAIRAAARRFIELVKAGVFDQETQMLGLEVAERLASHAQKEDLSMLPALEEVLDEEEDGRLADAYIGA